MKASMLKTAPSKIEGNSKILDGYAKKHQRGAEHTSETNAELVENESSEKEHQQENIDRDRKLPEKKP